VTKCYACKRELTNPTSVNLGIGPVCRSKRQRKLDAQERLDREARKCHFGFDCYNPGHVATLLGRLRNTMQVITGGDYPPPELKGLLEKIEQEVRNIEDCLGLNRPNVEVPKIEWPGYDEALAATNHRFNPADEVAPGNYRIPADIQRQYWHTKLREMKICPHGLDCRDPQSAVASVYRILSILKHEIDPVFRRYDGRPLAACDDRAFWHCANILSVLGFPDEEEYIIHKDIPAMKRLKRRRVAI
jgi:hypothetical protein